MSYKKATLYFMSGTGNSFRAAAWMGEAAGQYETVAQVIPMEQGNPASEIQNGREYIVGLVLPVHGFTAPWAAIRFALRLPRRQGTHAFILATRGSVKIGSVFLPGMEGTAAYLMALILAIKGYCIRGVRGLDMPSNWMSLHSGLNPEKVQAILSRSKPKAVRYCGRIFTGERYFGGLIELLLGLVLLPVSLAYLVIGRFYLAKLFYASPCCTGCGLCVANCSFGGVKIKGTNLRRPYWTFHCESCMRCMGFCPANAIEVSHPLAVVIYCISLLPIPVYLMQRLSETLPLLPELSNGWVILLLQYMYILLSIYVMHVLFNKLLRNNTVNKLLTYITLTHYYRRYHEPNTTPDMMQGDSCK